MWDADLEVEVEMEVRGPGLRPWEEDRGEAKRRNETQQGQRPLGSMWGRTRDGERVKEEKGLPEDQS